MNRSLSLIIPVYNEEGNLEKLINDLKEFFSDFENQYEILFIDDGSTDSSADYISKNLSENMDLIKHENNKGYGEALKTGFKESKMDLIGYIDGDNQFDVQSITKFLDKLNNHDMVIGERIKREDTWDRLLMSKGFNYLSRFLLNTNFKDIDCGIKVFRREVYEKIDLTTERTVDAELLAKTEKNNFDIKQVKVDHYRRDSGESEAEGLVTVRLPLIIKTFREIKEIRGQLKDGK